MQGGAQLPSCRTQVCAWQGTRFVAHLHDIVLRLCFQRDAAQQVVGQVTATRVSCRQRGRGGACRRGLPAEQLVPCGCAPPPPPARAPAALTQLCAPRLDGVLRLRHVKRGKRGTATPTPARTPCSMERRVSQWSGVDARSARERLPPGSGHGQQLTQRHALSHAHPPTHPPTRVCQERVVAVIVILGHGRASLAAAHHCPIQHRRAVCQASRRGTADWRPALALHPIQRIEVSGGPWQRRGDEALPHRQLACAHDEGGRRGERNLTPQTGRGSAPASS